MAEFAFRHSVLSFDVLFKVVTHDKLKPTRP